MGTRGESSREKAKNAILLFAADQKKHKRSEFVKGLVEKRKEFAKNTVYKYLDEAVADELMKMEPGSREDSFRPVYSITELGLEAVKQVGVHDLVDSLDTKWLEPLRKLLIRIKHEEPDVFFDRFCFTFIGDVPCAFTKSVEAMQSHIAFEESLHERHLRDLERFREDFMKTDKIGRARVETRIRDEVGWTIGEYLKKLLKKAEKEKGVRKIMTVLGITEEMLKEMNRKTVQHVRARKKAWHRFLEKHYPNVEKPIRDRELARTIQKEFRQYWEKEYWKEDVGAEKKS